MSTMPAARSDIVELRSYQAGDQVDDTIRLNANEAPVAHAGSTLNRYPAVRPIALQNRLSELFGINAKNLLVTRGSSEAIDVLIRCWCRAYADSIVTTPPTFEMYRVYADIQGVGISGFPLAPDRDFALDTDGLVSACGPDTKIVFLCSPNNPTGTLIPRDDVARAAEALADRTLVVVDEAYVEFSDQPSLVSEVVNYENLVVLRTLSKAHALAGARCGAAIASEPVIDVMSKVLPPYSFSTPVTETVLNTLSDSALAESEDVVSNIRRERERVSRLLADLDCVNRIWPSQANFILTKFHSLPIVLEFLLDRRILIRNFGNASGLENCARITIGTADENDELIRALGEIGDGR